MPVTRIITVSDVGGFVRAGDLPIGSVFFHASPDVELRVACQTPDGVIGTFDKDRRIVVNPTRLVRLLSLPETEHGSTHDDTDCDAAPLTPSPRAEALKALVLQYGVHSIEFGTTGVAWGSLSSRVRARLADEIDDTIDAIFAENAELRAKLTVENSALVFRCASVAQEEAHKWEGSALQASEVGDDCDLQNEQWARSHAEVARRIEEKIRSFAPLAEATITASIAREAATKLGHCDPFDAEDDS